MWAIGDPSGPIENGTTYIVRPRMAPVKKPVSSDRISVGSRQLFVAPASDSCSEQMKVRSSTRATSPGSDSARKLLGRLSSARRSKVPPAISSSVRRSHSASEPSHHSISSGWNTPAQCSTQSFSFWLVVIAANGPPVGVRGRSIGGRVVPWREAFGVEPRRPHVDLRTQPQARGPTLAVEVEDHALPLAEQTENRAFERVRGEVDLGQVGVTHHDPVTGPRVVRLDHSLHLSGSSRTARSWVPSPYRTGLPTTQSAASTTACAHRDAPHHATTRLSVPTVGDDGEAAQWATLVTLPDLMQPVQTATRLGAPLTRARTRWMFGFHRRLVRRCEWLTLMPHDGCLPHTSQTAAIACSSNTESARQADHGPGDPTGVGDQRQLAPPVTSRSIARVTTLERLGAAEVRAVVEAYRDALAAHREPINRLNVYPVPDGDTGTNMALTLASVADAFDGVPGDDMAATCEALSRGSLMGARGNSGVILSQVLRGMAGVVAEAGHVDGVVLTRALRAASDAAYQAVMRPVEGTILTVVRNAAEAAEAAVGDGGAGPGLVAVLDAALAQARDALDKTPEQLPVLAEAGVVDAGGAGVVVLPDTV